AVDVAGWQLWQALAGLGAFGAAKAPPTKQPARHASLSHTLPPPQVAPSGSGVKAAVAIAGWQLSQRWAGLAAPCATSVPPMKQPPWHETLAQTRPLPQVVPSPTPVHAVVDVAGWQRWQALAGFSAPAAAKAPAMKQPAWQAAALHTW